MRELHESRFSRSQLALYSPLRYLLLKKQNSRANTDFYQALLIMRTWVISSCVYSFIRAFGCKNPLFPFSGKLCHQVPCFSLLCRQNNRPLSVLFNKFDVLRFKTDKNKRHVLFTSAFSHVEKISRKQSDKTDVL